MTGVNEIIELQRRLGELRVERRRRHRRANWTFLLAGAGFGSAVYLARTRFAQLVHTGRLAQWAIIVGVGIVLFGLAARMHARALRLDEEIAEMEARIVELRK